MCLRIGLISVASASNSMLIGSGNSGHPWLVPDLRKAFSFSPLKMIVALCLSYTAFILLRYVPFIPNLLFLSQKDVELCHMLFLYKLRSGVSNIFASLGHTGRRVVLGHTLNTL